MTLFSLEMILFQLSLAFCALCTFGYLLSLLIKRVMLAKVSTWILMMTLGLLTLNLLTAFVNSAGLVNLGSRDFFLFCAWAVAGLYLMFQFKTKTRLLGAFISPFILLLMIAAAGQEAGKYLLPEDLRSWLITLHLFFAIIGEALFVLASCAGAMLIIQNSLLKHKKLGKMSRLLPPLDDLDRINLLCLLWGFPFLTIGIIAGAVFAGMNWKPFWTADPKIIWSVAAWVIYGFLLHQRVVIGWRGYRMAVFSCCAFILLLLSYGSVRFWFSTFHNFI